MHIQYIPRNMHTVFALLCFVVVIHWLIFPYPSGLLHWHCGNLTIAPVPTKQPWWIWINTSCEFIMNDYLTTTKQSTTKLCAYFLGYTVYGIRVRWVNSMWDICKDPQFSLRTKLPCDACQINGNNFLHAIKSSLLIDYPMTLCSMRRTGPWECFSIR